MSYISFIPDLEDCTFLIGSQVQQNNSYKSVAGSLGALDYERNKDWELILTSIKVKRNINGREYIFYSPPYSNSSDDLRIRIVFLKSVTVWFNVDNPMDYLFEVK